MEKKILVEMAKGLTERLAPVSLIGYLFAIDSPWETQVTFLAVAHVCATVFCLYHDHVEEVRERRRTLWQKG